MRAQNTTDAATLAENVFRPTNASERCSFSGVATVTFAGAAKTFAIELHTANTGDTAGIAFAYLTAQKVG